SPDTCSFSLHDALPIFRPQFSPDIFPHWSRCRRKSARVDFSTAHDCSPAWARVDRCNRRGCPDEHRAKTNPATLSATTTPASLRSEEHTSELQSRENLV